MIPRAAPGHLLHFARGRPFVLVAEGVADPAAAGSGALEAWSASARDGALLLHPAGTAPPAFADTVTLDTPPAGALAMVAAPGAGGAVAAALSRWWSGSLLAAGLPVIPAVKGQEALPGLLALLAEALVEARHAASGPTQGRSPAARRLVLSGQPGGPPLPGGGRHPLPVALPGIAALGLHLAGTGTGEGVLRLRLVSAAGGPVLGAWLVPATALVPGWLTLELPAPLGPLSDTGLLEIVAEGSGIPPLSREARPEPGCASAPALRAWAAPRGGQPVVPAFWAPEEAGTRWLAPGGGLSLPQASWEAARVLGGRLDAVAVGKEAPRLLLRAAAGQQAAVVFAGLHLPGIDRVRIDLEGAGGRGAAVAAWIRPQEETRFDASALDRPAPGADWTGWREPLDGAAALSLSVSAQLRGRGSLVIALRAGASQAAVEIEGIGLWAEPLEAPPADDAGPPPLESPAPPVPRPPLPSSPRPGVTGDMLPRAGARGTGTGRPPLPGHGAPG